MLLLALWLIVIILTPFVISASYPRETIQLIRKWKRQLYFRYAQKYGYWAANRKISLSPDEINPWERQLLEAEKELEPTESQFYSFYWFPFLKVAVGIYPLPSHLSLTRWQVFNLAMKGFFIRWKMSLT